MTVLTVDAIPQPGDPVPLLPWRCDAPGSATSATRMMVLAMSISADPIRITALFTPLMILLSAGFCRS